MQNTGEFGDPEFRVVLLGFLSHASLVYLFSFVDC